MDGETEKELTCLVIPDLDRVQRTSRCIVPIVIRADRPEQTA
jgi:hypothetical protein